MTDQELHACRYCGGFTTTDPSDQVPPADYCDHSGEGLGEVSNLQCDCGGAPWCCGEWREPPSGEGGSLELPSRDYTHSVLAARSAEIKGTTPIGAACPQCGSDKVEEWGESGVLWDHCHSCGWEGPDK